MTLSISLYRALTRSACDSSASASPLASGTTAAAATADPPIMKKRRRSTPAAACGLPWWSSALLSDGLLIAISSKSSFPSQSFGCLSASSGQRKGLGFQFHKDTPDTADGTVEIGRPGHLKIGEHPRSPRPEMPLEETRLLGEVGFEVAARKAGHHLKQGRDVVFRLPRRACAFDSEHIQIFADTRQRALVKKAGHVIGRIGKQLAATKSDEQSEELLADSAIIRRGSRRREFDMRRAKIGRIALQRGNPQQRIRAGRLAKQQGQQAVFRRAQRIDLVDFGFR